MVEARSTGLSGDALELAAGQAILQNMIAFPAILIVLFLWIKESEKS